ncbi:fungal-specific transcription factor domain-containing protein [Aspergillus alliaceus]|uniref:Fungal-specific transcription factor domain-containing protein n=1 Tax=Petromyces alliaceus TaxID=209559 RepID=A0A5N7C1G6_PETAA|nr:fungal-specific transcription factor domain-containing protein [Aspergillus alliaceus]
MMMSSVSFLDKPLLKVSRPVAACSRCRTAKIKCDGKLPACSACERVGKASTCSGASDEFARGKERSYVASLEGYCERLERRIADLRRHKESLSVDETGFIRESSITSMSSAGTVGQAHRKEVSDIDDLVGDFGFLSVNATSRDFHGIQSDTSFANLLLSLSVAEPIPKLSPQPLPARHEITPLLQHYFDNLFTQMPFFSETNFWTSVDTVYQAGGRFAKPSDHWFLRLVLAIASASMSLQTGDSSHQRALSLISGALPSAEDVLRPGSILGIQAILLLAQYSLFDPKHFRMWYLIGMAARALVDLGLHQDPPAEVLPADEQLDMRRRVFHCVYCLDRGVSTALERTFSLSDDSVNVALPSTSGSTMTGKGHIFLHSSKPAWDIVEIREILSSSYQAKYFCTNGLSSESTWVLCSRAREWFDNTPKNVPNYFPVLYKLELLYTTIMILSPTQEYSRLCDYGIVLLFDRSIQYTTELHRILETRTWLPLVSSLDIQRMYQVSRRLVDILRRNYKLVLSPSVPALPSLFHDIPKPPMLEVCNGVDCHGRAIECLDHIDTILQYGAGKWELNNLLEGFQQDAASVWKQLVNTPIAYHPGPGAYMAGPCTILPGGGTVYSDINLGHFNHNAQ